MKDNFMIGALIVVISLIVGYTAFVVTKTPDSPIEQIAEEVIDYELGLPPGTVDLSKEDCKK